MHLGVPTSVSLLVHVGVVIFLAVKVFDIAGPEKVDVGEWAGSVVDASQIESAFDWSSNKLDAPDTPIEEVPMSDFSRSDMDLKDLKEEVKPGAGTGDGSGLGIGDGSMALLGSGGGAGAAGSGVSVQAWGVARISAWWACGVSASTRTEWSLWWTTPARLSSPWTTSSASSRSDQRHAAVAVVQRDPVLQHAGRRREFDQAESFSSKLEPVRKSRGRGSSPGSTQKHRTGEDRADAGDQTRPEHVASAGGDLLPFGRLL